MRVTILGCGASGGVPLIGCDCAVCASDNPKNKRTRVSILIEVNGLRILVDTPPDIRMQALRHNIQSVDAIIYTHAHADHVHGIDDVRSFNFHKNAAIPVFADAQTLAELQERFAYVFMPPKPEYGWFRPALIPHKIEVSTNQPFTIMDKVRVVPFEQIHGSSQTTGIKIDDFAYSTDVNNLSDKSLQIIENVKLWIVDCLRYDPAPTHADLTKTLEWIRRVKPAHAVLTHMSHAFDYDGLRAELPDHADPAYDGFTLELP